MPDKDPGFAVVVAHYHPQGRVPMDLVELVQALSNRAGKVIFVSTGLSEAGMDRISNHAKVIRRENIGYDFWSYKVGIDGLGDLSDLNRLLLCNSSFITLNAEALCNAFLVPVENPALKGLTLSTQEAPHAQSFWVAFEGKELINSNEFEHWWASMTPVSDRQEVIDRYEIGMSTFFSERGIPLGSAFHATYEDLLVAVSRGFESRFLRPANVERIFSVDLERARQLNPTHFLWDSLLEQFSILKIDLVKKNPLGLNLRRLIHWIKSNPELDRRISDAISD